MDEGTQPDYERRLGVVEAITIVTRQCPNAAVRSLAEQALRTIAQEGASALPTQAYLVVTAMRGWRGDRATQVARSLDAFLADRAHGEHEDGD